MPDPSPALGRLVAHENSASDLLAFLFERDPKPLVDLLGLADDSYWCQREGKAAGRLDLAVYRQSDDLPVAVLELKGASREHGDQLQRYREWADTFDPAPMLYYCTLEGDGDVPPSPWRPLSLVALFGAWQAAADPHAAWLAREVTGVLRCWDVEADGTIGAASGWYVPDLVSRRTARALNDVLHRAYPGGGEASASRTKGGNPMFMAWRRHPHGSQQAWIAVDVRCEGRATPARPWLFRPCIDVYSADRPEREAVLEAHDLAVALQPAMVLPVIQQALTQQGRPELAEALHAERHGGSGRPADPVVLADWRLRLASGDKIPRRHPVFLHDRGLRLATQFQLDVAAITRADLADLTLAVLDHLVAYAKTARVPAGA
jgi:hypothetical protein